MGNNQSPAPKSTVDQSNHSQISHIKKSSKSSTKKLNSGDNFIIKFHKTYGGNQLDDIALSDKRRIVFVSLIGLFKSYKQCPSHILYTSLLVLPLKKKWIYNPNRYQKELQQQFKGMADDIFNKNDRHSKEKRMDFLRLLQWKDRQGFAFWMLDGEEYSKNGERENSKQTENEMNINLVTPFWKYFSNKLASIYDPVTDKKCNPLHLDEAYWRHSFDERLSKYKTSRKSIFMELYILTMKYATIQQIIYSSNPESLNPIITYDRSILGVNNDDENESKQEKTVEDEGFWISADYICDSSHGDIDYIHEEVDVDENEEEHDENMESYVMSEEPDSPEGDEADLSFKPDESTKMDVGKSKSVTDTKSKSNSKSTSNSGSNSKTC